MARLRFGYQRIPSKDQPRDLKAIAKSRCDALMDELKLQLLSSRDEMPDVLRELEEGPSDDANYIALREVLGYVTFVLEDQDQAVHGYWHGPEGLAASKSPIISYDTEGTIELLEGRGLLEAMIGKASDARDDGAPAENFAHFMSLLDGEDLGISAKSPSKLVTPRHKTNPKRLHSKLYAKYKKAAPEKKSAVALTDFKSPMGPEEWIRCLGLEATDASLLKLLKRERFHKIEDFMDGSYTENKQGLMLRFDEDEKLAGMEVEFKLHANAKVWKGPLPLGVTASDTRSSLRKRLGKPKESDGRYMDTWGLGDNEVTVIYVLDSDSIRTVRISRPGFY